jgi:hypothetical protein
MKGTNPVELFSPDVIEDTTGETKRSSVVETPLNRHESRDQKLVERQLERLRDYLEESLADPRSEVASLGMSSYVLMRMLLRLSESIDRVLEECRTDSDHYAVLLQGIEASLRLGHQIGQFTRLRLLLNEAREGLQTLRKG